MKIFGHPLHLLLIHFPSALFPMETVCYALFYFTGAASYGEAAYYAAIGGVGLGWLAMLFGAWDLIKIPPERDTVIKTALIHGSINGAVLIGFSVFAFAAFKKFPELSPARFSVLVIKALLLMAMLVGNYLGGQLVLKYKIGIKETTKSQ